LVAKAIASGGTDNVTAVVVDCASPEPSPLVDSLSIVSL
jgi:serine/threonine protein phosphatase PrpC